jgi:type II secretory pathway component GspD/PulD (secretin)
VSYADAKNLQERSRDLLTGRGRISVDERTNRLIVSDVAANLNLVEDLVRNLDTQTAQVVIEARIIEASSTFARQLGVQWGGGVPRCRSRQRLPGAEEAAEGIPQVPDGGHECVARTSG